MDDVQFEGEEPINTSYTSRSILGTSEIPGMVKVLKKTGVVKNDKQAFRVLFGVILACIVIAICVFVLFVRTPKRQISPEEIERMKAQGASQQNINSHEE